ARHQPGARRRLPPGEVELGGRGRRVVRGGAGREGRVAGQVDAVRERAQRVGALLQQEACGGRGHRGRRSAGGVGTGDPGVAGRADRTLLTGVRGVRGDGRGRLGGARGGLDRRGGGGRAPTGPVLLPRAAPL